MTLVRRAPGVWLLAALAYLPALSAAPGRMPADSKLYLYLDPGRLMSDGFHNMDPRQFAGWVPHQHIAYLWPSGPWFGFFELLGVPDWIAHRLWIGTLLFVAGLGVRWLGGLLGLAPAGALAAAVVYQCSPYLLPYVSRTSVMLLPWAGLGWIVGLTILAAVRSRWRHAALLALVVLTVGAVNATALAMIVPAPVLWLVHAAWGGRITWRRAGSTAARVAVLCVPVSLWWLVALVLQGRHGADVLAYSETLEAVTFTSTSSEVVRGLGYWLFYVRDPFASTTTAALDHLVSGRTVAIGLAVVLIGVLGLLVVRWADRRYAVLLVVAGVVLGVGLHPLDDPSPLMRFVTGDGESGLALALRSSTRAVPMSVLGFALGAGALVTALQRLPRRRPDGARRRRRPDLAVAAVVVTLAVLGLPALRDGGLVDPALQRDQDPSAAWSEAVAALDARADGYRVLQVPGAEFGAFRWGYTVDQPIPGLSDTPLVTRDLLPLGSPPVMDLVYALDDRLQAGVLEPAALAPVARLLGVRTVWLVNDQAWDRFRTPRPDAVAEALVDGAPGLRPPERFGTPVENRPDVAMVDEEWIRRDGAPGPLEPVWLLDVEDPVPVARAAEGTVLFVGDGAGLVDAAAADLLPPGLLVRYASTLDDAALDEAVAHADLVVVTDTDRPRARHWRSSQDTVGMTEDGSDRPAVLRPVDGDARLEFAGRPGTAHRTVAVQDGPVTARASAYGEPFAYRPEDRAVMALDGDPATAWRVADRVDAVGEHIVLELDRPADHVTLLQPEAADGARRITEVLVAVDERDEVRVDLDDRSLRPPGQRVDLDELGGAGTERIRITIAATDGQPDRPQDAVGFAVVDVGHGPTSEIVRLPTLDVVRPGTTGAIVMTRERVRPTDRWRADPEPVLRREITLARDRSFDPTVTVRLDRRAPDPVIAALLRADLPGADLPVADARLVGVPEAGGWSAFDGDDATAWVAPFGGSIGAAVRFTATEDLGTTTITQPVEPWFSTITELRVHGENGEHRDVPVPAPDAEGRSVIDLGGVPGGATAVEVVGVAPAVTIDRRYGEPTELPVAIRQLRGPGLPLVALPDSFDTGCRDDLLALDGAPVPLRVSGPVRALFRGEPATVELCDAAPWQLRAGTHRVEAPGDGASPAGLQVDRIVLRSGLVPGPVERPATTAGPTGRTARTIEVGPCPDGCWVVLGEGHNPAWQARVDGLALPEPEIVDGGVNGWWLEPSSEVRTVTVTWAPQRALSAALVLSALGILLCAVLAVGDRRRRPIAALVAPAGRRPSWTGFARPASRLQVVAVGAVWCALAALVVSPLWALAPLPLLAVAWWRRSLAPAGVAALTFAVVGAVTIVWRVTSWRPAPDAAWVLEFTDLHRPGLFFVTALAASALLADPPPPGEPRGAAPATRRDRRG